MANVLRRNTLLLIVIVIALFGMLAVPEREGGAGVSAWMAQTGAQDANAAPPTVATQTPIANTIRVGFIGLDTSHAGAFAKLVRDAAADSPIRRLQIVAAFPGGSLDIPSSAERVAGYTKEFRELGIEIVDSIEDLLPKVDAVILTSLDGRTHLKQALPVMQANKLLFIDKPLAADLADAIAIDLAAKKLGARWFTSSSLRFTPTIWRYRTQTDRQVLGAHAWSPCSLEPHHTDLTWYGIHGIEALYTAMGTGCQEVTRTKTDGTDVVVGRWQEDRVGLFRGIRNGTQGYGLTVFGSNFIESDAKYEGYEPLVVKIAEFFAGADEPVSNQESLEILTFIQAAQESSDRGGIPIRLADMRAVAEQTAKLRLESIAVPTSK